MLHLIAAFLAAAAPADAGTPAADKDKKICKSSATTGTRLARTRVCMTKAQWDLHYRTTERNTEELRRSPPLPPPQ